MIGQQWRAWRLLPNWNTDGRDIGWAEVIGFELLTLSILSSNTGSTHYKVYRDNKGVVEGWWKGRSRNKQTNLVFHRIHTVLGTQSSYVHTRYVPSSDNPADDPSRGVYPDTALLLPNIPIPAELHHLIADFNSEPLSIDSDTRQSHPPVIPAKPRCLLSENKHATLNAELDHHGEEFFSCLSHR